MIDHHNIFWTEPKLPTFGDETFIFFILIQILLKFVPVYPMIRKAVT